jgi:hypothetical protein
MKIWEAGEYCEEIYTLYSSSYIIRMIKSRRMRCARHIARMGEMRKFIKMLVGKPKGKKQLGRHRPDWRVILKWIFVK